MLNKVNSLPVATLLADMLGESPIGLLLVDKRAPVGFLPGAEVPLGIFLEHALVIAQGIEL